MPGGAAGGERRAAGLPSLPVLSHPIVSPVTGQTSGEPQEVKKKLSVPRADDSGLGDSRWPTHSSPPHRGCTWAVWEIFISRLKVAAISPLLSVADRKTDTVEGFLLSGSLEKAASGQKISISKGRRLWEGGSTFEGTKHLRGARPRTPLKPRRQVGRQNANQSRSQGCATAVNRCGEIKGVLACGQPQNQACKQHNAHARHAKPSTPHTLKLPWK